MWSRWGSHKQPPATSGTVLTGWLADSTDEIHVLIACMIWGRWRRDEMKRRQQTRNGCGDFQDLHPHLCTSESSSLSYHYDCMLESLISFNIIKRASSTLKCSKDVWKCLHNHRILAGATPPTSYIPLTFKAFHVYSTAWFRVSVLSDAFHFRTFYSICIHSIPGIINILCIAYIYLLPSFSGVFLF